MLREQIRGEDKSCLKETGVSREYSASIGLLGSCPSVLMGLCLQPFSRKPSQGINSGDNAYANEVDW